MHRGLGSGCPTPTSPHMHLSWIPDKLSVGKKISWFKKSSNDCLRIKRTYLVVEGHLWEVKL